MPVVTPLPSGSGVTGMNSSLKSRQPAEHLIAVRGEPMIDAHAELILIDRLVVDAPVVVGGAGAGRQRIPVQQRRARPDPSARRESCCPGTGCASPPPAAGRRRRRIVDGRNASADGLGEDALALQQRRHRGDHRAADRLPLALVVDEEERPIAPNRPADDAAELVAAELRLDRVGRGEEVARVQRFVAEELEGGAAKRVAARTWSSG